MAQLTTDGTPSKILGRESFKDDGELVDKADELALVVQSAEKASSWIASKQWLLTWRDADLLLQSPQPLVMVDNTYVREPRVKRFTVGKVVNAIVPQFYKGLFYDDPPFVVRPRPGTSQAVIDAKRAIASYLFDLMEFKKQVKLGLEQFTLLGTCIFKWGVEYKPVIELKRKVNKISVPAGDGQSENIPSDAEPEVTETEKTVCTPFFEFRDIRDVFVDPKCKTPDIRDADYVIDKRYMDFYQLDALKDDPEYDLPEDLINLWFANAESQMTPGPSPASTISNVQGIVHHAEEENVDTSGDPLRRKLEVLEFQDKERFITVLNRKAVIRSVPNKYKVITFYSANYWNIPKAFYGMGCGTIVGSNQLVDQGLVSAALRMLAYGVNPTYVRTRDSNAPTQMIYTSLGKILTVDGKANEAFDLLPTPKIPPEIWPVLKESEQATESSTGADQMLVQGSSAGPRSSMGRTAGGANILAGASSSRLEGPLDNFLNQVYVPWLYRLDELILRHISDADIQHIVGQELGAGVLKDWDQNAFNNARCEFEVLAGTHMMAKRTMAQSMTLITQIFQQPQIIQQIAEVNGEYVDWKPILKMWMEMSEWTDVNDVIKPLTPEMKQRLQEKSQNNKFQQDAAKSQQQFQQKQQLLDEANNGRIKRDIIREAFRASGMREAVDGQAVGTGFGANEGVEQ